MSAPDFIAVSVGNTRTQVAAVHDDVPTRIERAGNDDLVAIVQVILDMARSMGHKGEPPPIAIASVNNTVSQAVAKGVQDQLGTEVYTIGDDIPVPIGVQLDPETITGADRLLNAAGAFATLQQACIVVDAGTAVTVDFVDGKGTFHGGAIAPGARMQLDALHAHTAALPEVSLDEPVEAFGRSTAQAMLHGVVYGIRGMVWKLVERYAAEFGAFPTVIATGGDAELLFADDELVDRIVPDLTLRGMIEAVRHALADHAGPDRSEVD